MERPRPRAKHRSKKKRESVPSHITTKKKKDMSRPRPSPKLMKHRISSSHPTKKSVLFQSKSPESKEEPPLIPTFIPDLNISSSKSPKSSTTDDTLLNKLSKIKQHQKTRKSQADFDEIKQFIHNQNTATVGSINARNIDNKHTNLPTSLKLMGIRNPSSLLYHRQFDQQYVDKVNHHRAQSSIVTINSNKNITPEKIKPNTILNVNDKFNHLRSYSSIMANNNTVNNSEKKKDKVDNVGYVKNAKNRQPSEIFSGNVNGNNKFKLKNRNSNVKRTKSKKEILQELADEYESESDEDDNNQDDDLKRDK